MIYVEPKVLSSTDVRVTVRCSACPGYGVTYPGVPTSRVLPAAMIAEFNDHLRRHHPEDFGWIEDRPANQAERNQT